MSETTGSEGNSISHHDIGEALYHGEAYCGGCRETVDLSDAEDVEEAGEIWNEHVLSAHPEKVLDGAVVGEVDTGDKYEVAVTDDGLELESADTPRSLNAQDLHHGILLGKYYIPEGNASTIQTAIQRLAEDGGRDE